MPDDDDLRAAQEAYDATQRAYDEKYGTVPLTCLEENKAAEVAAMEAWDVMVGPAHEALLDAQQHLLRP
jgi:hypothetical protein